MADQKTPSKTTRKSAPKRSSASGAKTPPRPSAKRKAAAPRKAAATRKAPAAKATRAELKQNFAATRDSVSKLASETTSRFKSDAAKMSEDASARAKVMARDGKDKAAGAIATFAKYIEDSAGSVDDRLGDQYGDYARTAAASIAGFASTIEKQDIDELVDGTREFVRKSPAIAIGTAAAIGFVMARMLKGGSSDA